MEDYRHSLKELGKFFDHAADKGLIKRNTASSRKTAATKVLSVLEPGEQQDLRNVDIDAAFERFSNLNAFTVTPGTLKVYRNRVKLALKDFFAWTENPSAFKTVGAQRKSAKASANPGGNGKTQANPNSSPPNFPQAHPPASNQLTIPVPIRPGMTIVISNIPPDLTEQEAAKLAAVVSAYAVPAD